MAGSYQPMKVLPKFYTIDASSLSCEQYLEKVTGVSFKELMADFYTAVAAGESSGKYSFYGDTIAAAKAATFPVQRMAQQGLFIVSLEAEVLPLHRQREMVRLQIHIRYLRLMILI